MRFEPFLPLVEDLLLPRGTKRIWKHTHDTIQYEQVHQFIGDFAFKHELKQFLAVLT